MTLLRLILGVFIVSTSLAWTSPATPRHGTLLKAVKTDEELLPAVREGIADLDATDAWNDCVDFLSHDVCISTEQAEVLLASAMEWRGWARVTSPIARKYMKPKVPNVDQLQSALGWLRDGPLGMTDNLLPAIEASPKAYLVDPAGAYQEALDTAPKQYKDTGDLQALILDDPSALECSYNCKDEGCGSECGNCWVSYELKRGGPGVEI